MIIINRDDALNLINTGDEDFIFPVKLNFIVQFQLYLSGNVIKGIELFGIGPQEIRGLGFMVEFHDLVNGAIRKHYRVFIVKEGSYFRNGDWHLRFNKSS